MATELRATATALPGEKDQEEVVGEVREEEAEAARRGGTENPGRPEMESTGSLEDRVAEEEGEAEEGKEEGEEEGELPHQVALTGNPRYVSLNACV